MISKGISLCDRALVKVCWGVWLSQKSEDSSFAVADGIYLWSPLIKIPRIIVSCSTSMPYFNHKMNGIMRILLSLLSFTLIGSFRLPLPTSLLGVSPRHCPLPLPSPLSFVGALSPSGGRSISPASFSLRSTALPASTASGYVNEGGWEDGMVDSNQVEDLLVERNLYRDERNFEDADDVRNELGSMGVVVFDNEKVWCVRGKEPEELKKSLRRYSNYVGERERRNTNHAPRDFGPLGHDMKRCQDCSKEYTDAELDEVNKLIKERLQFKLRREYNDADLIKEQLWDMGVEIDDGSKRWRGDGKPFMLYEKWGSYPIENEDVVRDLILQRIEAKKTRNYDTADRIKEEVLEKHGVIIDDRYKSYRAAQGVLKYTKADNCGEMLDDQEAGVELLIEKRAKAKSAKEYGKADKLSEELAQRFKVYVDDIARTYSTEIWDYKCTCPDDEDITPEMSAEISAMVKKRAEAKYSRSYRFADAIREELREKFNVEVDDKKRTWWALKSF